MKSNKKAQVTIFIILAILIVGGIIAYFALRGSFTKSLSTELKPVYDYYLSCLEQTSKDAIKLLGEQSGHIETPPFIPGSSFMPFSSQLDFLGQGIPYWMYISGNNIYREQVPTIPSMQQELDKYIEERLTICDFSDFQVAGYDVYVNPGNVETKINDLGVTINIQNTLNIFYENQTAQINHHELNIKSKLGKFYKLAKEIYDSEKKDMFLEYYALDVMRLYAPVTGVEESCSPKVFIESKIKKDIKEGLSLNIPTIKLEGNYYELSSKERDYFVAKSTVKSDENVNFLYSSDWPTSIEISGDKVVTPIGLQQGLGLLGFCYIPYNLIYDINFPVLVQLFDGEELFQFPLAVIISRNQPRVALPPASGLSIESPVCNYKNQDVEIRTYDLNLNPVEAQITFKCINSVCEIGQTRKTTDGGFLSTGIPQCVNGFLVARAEGYSDAKYQISSNLETSANLILRKKYDMPLDLGNVKKALVTFDSEDYSATAIYPDMKSIELVEGYYNVSVYVYENSSIKFPGTNERKCVDVPEEGISGMLGQETEKCFDINIPETSVSFAIVGGGKTQEYILEDQLAQSSELNINIPLFGIPKDLKELQKNYEAVDIKIVYLNFE